MSTQSHVYIVQVEKNMKEHASYQVAVGGSEQLPNGYIVNAEVEDPTAGMENPGSTAWHEARHTGVSLAIDPTSIADVDIIPSGNALGTTRPTKLYAAAVIAPDEAGDGGTSHDRGVLEAMREAEGPARSVARSLMSSHHEGIRMIAFAVQKKKRLSGKEALTAMRSAYEPKLVKMTVQSPEGKIIHLEERTNNKVIPLRGDIFTAA